jgi:putative FmdB family regulatory protein
MPKYLYKCTCGEEISVISAMKDYSPTVTCDKCGEVAERKVENMVCGLSIDNTNSFYRKCN